jgi:hypothetical protein
VEKTKAVQHATTGKFVRTPEQIANDRRAADLRSLGYTYQMIADRFDVTVGAAHKMVSRAVAEIPNEGAQEVRKIELEKIDNIERYYQSVIAQPPPKVGNTGKLVLGADGKAVPDEDARMAAAAGILKAQAQRARLLGLNAPTSTRHDVVVYDVDSDAARMIEAQTKALEALGLHDRIDEFRTIFVSALGSGEGAVIDAEWSSEEMVVPE